MNRSRFSLLLLEPGEYYFEDHSVYFSCDDTIFDSKDISNDLIGRLKICSKSLVFDSRNSSKPLIKIPLKECTEIKQVELRLFSDYSEIMLIECEQYVEMLADNLLAPYTFKHEKRKFYALFNYARIEDCLPQINQLRRAASLPVADHNQMIAVIAFDRQNRVKFDPMWLENFDEKVIFETIGSKICPLVVNPGKIVLTTLNLFFQPFNNIEPQQYIKIRLSEMKTIIKRRFLLQHVGLEIYGKENNPSHHIYLTLKSGASRDELYNAILKQPELKLLDSEQEIMTLQWQNGTISNFDYLLYINSVADRTYNDLTQYPIFPWVIADYTSSTLDLSDVKSFRDLSKPIGALNPDRLKRLKDRYDEMAPPKFLYGSHYSTPGFVLFYLVRKYPNYMLCLQNGKFDHPDRMFNNVADIWRNVLTNMSDFKELVPEFYDTSGKGDFLVNFCGVNFGYKQDGIRVGDVTLPPWASSPEDFVDKLREALECDYVSSHLHQWIDLIFGYKQTGEEAEKANNNFFYVCYEGGVNLDSVKDWNQRHALEVQIMEFGQIPKQIFRKPHPARTCAVKALEKELTKIVLDDSEKDFDIYWQWKSINASPSFTHRVHKNEITGVKFSNDSQILYSVSRDNFFKMLNTVDFKQERSVPLSRTDLTTFVVLDDNNTAIIGCWDNCILVYNIECSSIIDKFTLHEDSISCLNWCKKSQKLVTGSHDYLIRIWRAKLPWTTMRPSSLLAQLLHETKVSCLTVSSDEKLMASGTDTGNVFLWSMDTYKIIYRLNGHEGEITDLKFNSVAERLISCSLDRSFRIYDLSTGSQVYFKYLDEALNCVCWDGCHVLLGGKGGKLYLWDLVKNKSIQEIKSPSDEEIVVMTINQNGSSIATGGRNGRINIWSTIEEIEDDQN